MSRRILFLVALFALAFGLIALLKTSRKPDATVPCDAELLKRENLARFWRSFHRATRLRTEGNFEEAVTSYQRALVVDPEHEESLYYLGNCFFELGEYAQARDVLERLTAVNPLSQRAYSQLGVVLSSRFPGSEPDLKRAQEAFERNAELDPEESGPFLRLGNVALSQNQLELAFRHFETAAGFASPEGMFWAGFVCFLQERYAKAAEFFERVLSISELEQKVAKRGVVSEGDTNRAGTERKMSALRRAELKAQLYLSWSSSKIGRRTGIPKSSLITPSIEVLDGGRLSLDQEDLGRGSWADIDLDGDPDLMVVSEKRVAFFENRSGEFRDRTAEVGLDGVDGAWDASWGDYDGDRDPDLYLIRSGFIGEGTNSLFCNDRGRFKEVTGDLGISGRRATSRALFFDFDGDGLQDLLEIGNRSDEFAALRLYRNEGRTFREISSEVGLEISGVGVDCAAEDYDLDGDVDLFILRWRRPGILFRNESGVLFRDVTLETGLAGAGGNSFSVLFLDYDRDDRPDLLVTEYAPFAMVADCLVNSVCSPTEPTQRLFRNTGKGTFDESAGMAGLSRPVGILQAVTADFNSDGWPDLLFSNGSLEVARHEPSLLLLNDGGRGFAEAAFLPGFQPANCVGAAVAEISGGAAHHVYLAGVGLLTVQLRRAK